jgi:hypothetical protein
VAQGQIRAQRSVLQGLIQLAGAFVHLQKNRLRPAAALFKLALANLEKYPREHEHLNLTAVCQLIQKWLGSLESAHFEKNPLADDNAPKLALELPITENLSMNKKRVVLAGGSGFLGQALAKELLQRDYEAVILTRELRERDEEDEVREVEWDGEHIGEWIKCLDGAETVVNLAGRNINCRHTPENLREITESRVNAVRAIAAAICHVKRPPRVWVQAGAVGFYGNCGDQWCDETAPNGRIRWRKSAVFGKTPSTQPPHSTPAACCSESAWCWAAMAGHCPCWPI